MTNPLKYIFNLSIAAVIILLVVKIGTFGWRPVLSHSLPEYPSHVETAVNLHNTVKVLTVDIGVRNFQAYDGLSKAADYIENSFKELGYHVVRQTYKIDGKVYANIIAHLDGFNRRKEAVVVGAHYDSCFTPGADDNATGVAALLELARLLKDERSAKQIEFVAFTNEEPPFFSTPYMGSRVFVHRIKKDGHRIKAAVILEMLGYYSDHLFSQRYLPLMGVVYPNQGNFISVVGNFPSIKQVRAMVRGFKNVSSFPIESLAAPSFIPGIYFSDHASFWAEGYPAIMVTDTGYLRNKNYHHQTDTIDTINFSRMSHIIYGLKEGILRILSSK